MKKEQTLEQLLRIGIIRALGKVWMYWPPRHEVKTRCKVPGKTGWWKCEDKECNRETEKLEIDHIIPTIKPDVGFVDWNSYIESKFVTSDKLQGLCHESHQKKNKKENKIRREQRKKNENL